VGWSREGPAVRQPRTVLPAGKFSLDGGSFHGSTGRSNRTPAGRGLMKVWGYVLVAASFVTTAFIAHAIIRAVKPDSPDLARVVAATVATQVGVLLRQRQDAKAPLFRVKL